MQKFLPWALVLWLTGCAPPPPWDTAPPRLLEADITPDGKDLDLEFSEPLAEAQTGGNFGPGGQGSAIEGSKVSIPLPQDLEPGKAYEWTAEVRDPGNNLTSVRGRFFGPNSHPAVLRINEVRIAGSGAHPDFVELRVEKEGNLGGWTLEGWSGPETKVRFVFPSGEAATGDIVLAYWKDPVPEDEKEIPHEVLRYNVPGAKGLPGTKGLVVLRPSPGAPPADGILYSQVPEAGTPLAEAAGWDDRTALDPRGCTPTRTWCRAGAPESPWVLVTTGAGTPGKPNRIIPWAGQTSNLKGVSKTKE